MSQNLQFFGKSNLMVSTNVIETMYSILNIVNINKVKLNKYCFFVYFKKFAIAKMFSTVRVTSDNIKIFDFYFF